MRSQTPFTMHRPWATSLLAALCLVVLAMAPASAGKTYTLNADFDEGKAVNVGHPNADQLELARLIGGDALPFIWIPNSEGSVSKVDVKTGREVARYRICDPAETSMPSRTTVDLYGNCWVGNRQAGSVVKIGLQEGNQWIDRNGNGQCDTSHDTNNDGNITGSEMLAWGADECVLFEVIVIPDKEQTCVPGTYTGGYANKYWDPGPRSLAVDSANNLWCGCYETKKWYYIDGETGRIVLPLDVSEQGHNAYGAVMDGNGVIWSASLNGKHLLRVDPLSKAPEIDLRKVDIGHMVYGVGLDYLGHVFVAGYSDKKLTRLNCETGEIDWTVDTPGGDEARGVVCTRDNDVWVANSKPGTVCRYDNEGNLKATIDVGSQPTGVAVDCNGKVWVCNNGDDYIKRIDPATNRVDLSKAILNSKFHYSYSDMTGFVARMITARRGTWTACYDGEASNSLWGLVKWNAEVPPGTSLSVRARSSNDKAAWSPWELTTSGEPLADTPPGRYLEVQTTFRILAGESSPVLYDLHVRPKRTLSATFRLQKDEEFIQGAKMSQIAVQEKAGNATEFSPCRVVDLHENRETAADKTLILAVDMSGSMSAPLGAAARRGGPKDRLEAAKAAAEALVDRLAPTDLVGLVTFHKTAQLVQPLTPATDETKEALKATIEKLKMGTSTAFYDAIMMALGEISQRRQRDNLKGPAGIIALTDGRDTDSTAVPADVLAAAQTAAVPVFTCGLCIPGKMADDLKAFTEGTGGVYSPAETLEEITKAFEDAFTLLDVTYTVTWTSLLETGTQGTAQINYSGPKGRFEVTRTPFRIP
jgi:streptogramin lyase/Mg-chelatase subunit ChlD